jgi:hypothetical protein
MTVNFKKRLKNSILKNILGLPLPVSLANDEMQLDIRVDRILLPDKYCCLNFDDLCPVGNSVFLLERGGTTTTALAKRQAYLFERFPTLAITHFVIPRCIPNDFLYLASSNHFSIDNPKNGPWLEFYKSMIDNHQVEFAVHGCHHRQWKNPFFSRHTEFSYCNESETKLLIEKSIRTFNKMGIQTYGFRQPGWDFSVNSNLIDVLIDLNFEYAGLSSYNAGLNANAQRVDFFHPNWINRRLINFPDNINLDWPIEKMKDVVDRIYAEGGFVNIKGHFVEKKYMNCFSSVNFEKLIELLNYIQEVYGEDVKFLTLNSLNQIIRNSKVGAELSS